MDIKNEDATKENDILADAEHIHYSLPGLLADWLGRNSGGPYSCRVLRKADPVLRSREAVAKTPEKDQIGENC